ncbi:MAG: hypothetical protein F6K55_15780 [Moorea sp. SIO4A3]|nr:hypothetical protein [Moorena sp. SIO4A3]
MNIPTLAKRPRYANNLQHPTLAKRPRYANNLQPHNLQHPNLGQKATLREQPSNLQPSTKKIAAEILSTARSYLYDSTL